MADKNGPGPGGSNKGSSLKFRPNKVERRSGAERQAAAQQIEQAREEQARAAAAAASSTSTFPSYRGRFHRGRGASAAGRGSSGIGRTTLREGAGPLSGPSPANRQSTATAVLETQESSSKPGEEVSSGPSTRGAGRAAQRGGRKKQPEVKAESEDESEPTIVVESEDGGQSEKLDDEDEAVTGTRPRDYYHLDSVSDSEDDYSWNEPRLRPVAIERHEHVERVKNVNTEATSAASARLRQQALQRRGAAGSRRDPGVRRGRKSVPTPVKSEARGAVSESLQDEMDLDVVTEPMESATQPQQVEEELEEHDRLENDRKELLRELGRASRRVYDSEFHLAGKSSTSRSTAANKKKLFIFQLPPVLPYLVPRPNIHLEPSVATLQLQSPPNRPNSPPQRTSSRRKGKQKVTFAPAETPSETVENSSGGAAAASDHAALGSEAQKEPLSFAAPDVPTFSGRVGTLRVFADGQARMSWGGLEYDVQRGCVGTLLQDVVVMDSSEPREGVKKKPNGTMEGIEASGSGAMDVDNEGDEEWECRDPQGVALGQPASYYVVTPAWSSLLAKAT